MAIEQEAPSDGVTPLRDSANVMRISKEEEGSSKGEFWAFLRALAVLIGAIMLIGYLIG